VGSFDGSLRPRILNTRNQRGSWIALSHCWGKKAQAVTTSQNLSLRQENIPWEELSQTNLDAIFVTRRLGYRYLWIDLLCILQDNSTDWELESAQMGRYYKNSVFTIAVDAADGDDVGFLQLQREQRPMQISMPCHSPSIMTEEIIYLRETIRVPDFRGDTCLSKRAWALQEDLSSPRTLHYTAEQMVWECQYMTLCESDTNNQRNNSLDLDLVPKRYFLAPDANNGYFDGSDQYNDPLYRWMNIVANFLTRSLTFEDDKFPAISGVAREIHEQTDFIYRAGTWVEDIRRGLLWNTNGAGRVPAKFRAPSWSWAALDLDPDEVKKVRDNGIYNTILFSHPEITSSAVNVLDHQIVPKDIDPYGRLVSGYLVLRGLWLPLAEWRGHHRVYLRSDKPSRYKSHFFAWWDSETSLEEREIWPEHPEQLICNFGCYCPEFDIEITGATFRGISLLQISAWDWVGNGKEGCNESIFSCALMLAKTNVDDIFKRVGTAEVPWINALEKTSWSERDVKII